MTINKTQENGKIIFALEGSLDTATSPQLQNVLLPAFDEAKQIELDFSQLLYISSAGLRILLLGQKAAESKGASMRLRGVSDEIKNILSITGLYTILTIV